MSGSQWSAKGSETNLRPVSQLEIRQKTIPFSSPAPGGEVVKTIGSYRYVRHKAFNQPVV
jgi:hypothetical protein